MKYQDNTPIVLKGINLRTHSQEMGGAVGRTGSGERGVALLRLAELAAGRILIDSVDICSISLGELRSKLSLIPQEPVLFISKLPQRLQAEAMADGKNSFSVGERQRLCITCALRRSSEGSLIGVETGALVQQTVCEAFQGCTVLVIAHRITAVLNCGLILAMDHGKGRVAEFDSPVVLQRELKSMFAALLAKAGSLS
ncbi:LOW QUALITY PROTEIN: ATP-binding cassette sub-family C member 11-like [Pteronotus mesoamericanus]|uniref:LOW QUALITY PROTEIN: ATP-binding cassette sub-family C member 11-like n=1 Tax=Pteronotus mesoamericanus TaxID=1884717 RepID=UPI0023EB9A5D|nr:LOW QUALITY PROTEIN: ATP-binding cassette sub-family C member 11-like [Pteronotus parnellii mesoamericanus]